MEKLKGKKNSELMAKIILVYKKTDLDKVLKDESINKCIKK
jgi:hypothetical protein